MLMVIFGAGASLDSAQACRLRIVGGAIEDDGLIWRPPLANGLFLDSHRAFGTFVERYPRIRAILQRLREPKRKSVEEILESLQGEVKEYAERLAQLASVRFYLRDLLYACTNRWLGHTNGVTNYQDLIDQMLRRHRAEEETICLVTFNYDLLLERALMDFGFQLQEPRHFLALHPVFKVFKLHGSVNWARYVEHPNSGGPAALIDSGESMKLRREWLNVGENENSRSGSLLWPSIAIPVQTKSWSTFECPEEHLEHLGHLLKRVTKVLIIGWQAREAHFLQMLKDDLPKLVSLMVVCGSWEAGKKVLDHFVEQVGPKVSPGSQVSAGGFTDFVVNGEGDEFFKA
jgi:hypothetical protein